MSRKSKYIVGITGVLTICFIFYFLDPLECPLFPKCPFLVLTGLECPGCGTQRALHSLLHLHIIDTLRYNALLIFSLPYIALLLYAEMGRTRYPKLYIAIHRPIYIRCYLIVVILWWIGRNLTTNF